jgi:hypothetical protein
VELVRKRMKYGAKVGAERRRAADEGESDQGCQKAILDCAYTPLRRKLETVPGRFGSFCKTAQNWLHLNMMRRQSVALDAQL